VRQRKKKDAEHSATPRHPRRAAIFDMANLDTNDSPTDWRELGRRVLGEAMRRSLREFRRRNGCRPKSGPIQGRREGPP